MKQHYYHYDIVVINHNESKNGKKKETIFILFSYSKIFFCFSDTCCIASNGAIDWSSLCYLYYEIRPPSTCNGYQPPAQGRLFNKVSFFNTESTMF
jgi:hypothetical protein